MSVPEKRQFAKAQFVIYQSRLGQPFRAPRAADVPAVGNQRHGLEPSGGVQRTEIGANLSNIGATN